MIKAAKLLKLGSRSHLYQSVCQEHRWTSNKIRKAFVEFFVDKDHLYVPSSSVIPKKNDGSYFVNSGMNQFKPLFTGIVDPSSEMASYKRVANYQKCIRVGGKHNDINHVGHDNYHHTFFEMLGNWSFNDYSKLEACQMAWELLTQVFKVPQDKLYVTYFKGDKDHRLMPDFECRDIWLGIGVPKERILPFGSNDNFWMMGDTGPCGPCSEIHYCHEGGLDGASLVNRGNENVVEIWNLVFMEYDRQPDGTLKNLPHRHIDTGMGLERLTALLQNTSSNYKTDLFEDIFSHISQTCEGRPFQNSVVDPVDVAYRIVADHARMFTVAISDGLMPGRKESEAKLRHIIYRCLYQSNEVFKAPVHFIDSLVPVVVHSLQEAYPHLSKNQKMIKEAVRETENRYLESISTGRQMMKKALSHYGDFKVLSGEQILKIQEGRFGKAVSYDIISLLAPEFNVTLSEKDYENVVAKNTLSASDVPKEQVMMTLNQHDLKILSLVGIKLTGDLCNNEFVFSENGAEYDFPVERGEILALKMKDKLVDFIPRGTENCGVVLDTTCFYAEGGGQICDTGRLWKCYEAGSESSQDIIGNVINVTKCSGYIFHQLDKAEKDMRIGDIVSTVIDVKRRVNCMANHTATHIINLALNKVLGHVKQQGSLVKDTCLTFDFTCLKSNVTKDDLKEVVEIVNEIVKGSHEVYHFKAPLKEILEVPGLTKLDDEVYPSVVQVVAIGSRLGDTERYSSLSSKSNDEKKNEHISLELCCGTHVAFTNHLQGIVITNFEGSSQGTKRITAVTREHAAEAIDNAKTIREELDEVAKLKDVQEIMEKLKKIDTLLSNNTLLPKLDRESFMERVKMINLEISQHKHSHVISSISEAIQKELSKKSGKNKESDSLAVITVPFDKSRDVIESILTLNLQHPAFILANSKTHNHIGVVFIPDNFSHFKSEDWSEYVCKRFEGQHSPPKGKLSKHTNVSLFSIPVKNDRTSEAALIAKVAEEFADTNQKEYRMS